jgi:hypothetical protein
MTGLGEKTLRTLLLEFIDAAAAWRISALSGSPIRRTVLRTAKRR